MYDNFYYDPQRDDYIDSEFWETITGTPAVAANYLVLNSAAAIGNADIQSGDVVMSVKVPAAPTAGDVRRFGLAQLNLGAYVGFRITDDALFYECVDGAGGDTNDEITWNSDWTDADVEFRIVWNNFNVSFYINGQKIMTLNNTTSPFKPLSLYVNNGNSDDLKVKYIDVRNARMI